MKKKDLGNLELSSTGEFCPVTKSVIHDLYAVDNDLLHTEEVTLPDTGEERVLALRRERQIKGKLKVEEALRTHRKFVITGKPGSGKSTTLKHLCLKSVESNLQVLEREVTPVFVVLREFVESGCSFRDFINETLDKYGFPEASEFIEKDLEVYEYVLIIKYMNMF